MKNLTENTLSETGALIAELKWHMNRYRHATGTHTIELEKAITTLDKKVAKEFDRRERENA